MFISDVPSALFIQSTSFAAAEAMLPRCRGVNQGPKCYGLQPVTY
jgi:hypothetical protein